ncbi:MAG: topoisomerase IV [Ruminococcaceae bacterium]|nr:topoisomerase IV [Oscillospiraceae bacterium]
MNQENYIEQNIVQALETNYMPYAMSVIISRAIPEIDGFKPAHRKLLYTMYKMNLLSGPRTKSSNVVGQTMKLNPHGDMAIYETMVRLTKGNGALLHPFVDSKGNFGKQQSRDMAFAAPRYTEVRLEPICADIFGDIDKNTVDFVDNYDGELKEPTLLPTAFPNILVNPNQGIAVGMASNICSFNLNEVCKTTVAYLKDADCDLKETLIAPDFSTGGQLIYNQEEISAIYETGRGSFKVRSKYRYDKKNNCIEIYEIPYTTTVEAIIDKIVELVKQGKIREVSDMRDETDLSGLKLTLDLKRGTDPDKLMARLFKQTPLEDSFSCNFNILIDGKPKVMGVREILQEWTRFRLACIKRRLEFDLDKKSHRLHLLLGLEKILMDIDKAVRIIRETETESLVIPNLMQGFSIDTIQAEFIAEIKLRHLNKEYILKRLQDIDQLKQDIADLQTTLASNIAMKKLIIKELDGLMKKYGKERTTEIIHEDEATLPELTNIVEDYNVKMFLTEQNYVKKISLVSLRANADQKLKEDDRMLCEAECSNKDEALFFSNKQNCYKMKMNDIPDTKASALGEYLPNLLGLEQDEKILYMAVTDKYEGFMLFAYENGKIAKVPLASYETKTNRKKLTNAYYANSPLADIRFLMQDTELVAMSDINKILIFDTTKIPEKTTRSSMGVQVLTPKKGSILAKISTLDEVAFTDFDYYRTKNIPARGAYLKPEDAPGQQMTLL